MFSWFCSGRRRKRMLAIVILLATTVAQTGLPSSAEAGATEVDIAARAVTEAAKLAAAGDAARAQEKLSSVRSIIESERAEFDRLLSEAQSAREQCTDAVALFDRRIGDATASLEQSASLLQTAQLSLNDALRDQKVSTAELRSLRNEAARVTSAAKKRQGKLKELNDWWWVPGYGAYLGIRTLADKDIQKLQSLERDLEETKILMLGARERMKRARELARHFTALKTRHLNEAGLARFMQRELRVRLGQTKSATLGILEIKDFWQDLDRLAAMRLAGAIDSFSVEVDLVSGALTGVPSGMTDDLLGYAGTLADVLREVSDGIASGDAFNRLDSVRCSEDTAEIAGLAQVEACEIRSEHLRWPHIEFVGKGCGFRYVYPPGCPGRAQEPANVAKMTPSLDPLFSALKDKSRGLKAPGRNWVGAARCTGTGDMFFGKLRNAAACEAACNGNKSCHIWTYNEKNGSIRDTSRECWGLRLSNPFGVAAKGAHSGFVSGGTACVGNEICSR